MLRILHTADVHLGARHADLGEQATAQRERQFAAFRAAVDLALAQKVDLFLVAGDLFDSNTQPRRSVERVAAELARLAASKIRSVIIPGTHDVYDRASVYRAFNLAEMAGSSAGDEWVVVLTPDRPDVHFEPCDVVVHGRVFATKRAPHSPLRDLGVAGDTRATWHVAMAHAAIAIPGKTDGDSVVIRTEEIAASGLDYLARGHWHSMTRGLAGSVQWAYPGAPEPVAIDQDRAGKVLVVTLEEASGGKHVSIEEHQVGKTRFERLELDAAALGNQPALEERVAALGDPDLVLDVRLIGVRPDDLDIHTDEVEARHAGSFLRLRVRDVSRPPLTEGALPPPDTIVGAFLRNTQARIAELEKSGKELEAAELRDVLRLGRLLLGGHEVTL